MPRIAEKRNRIMDVAQASILAKGFAGTSIEEIVAAADVTRSGFFYHFRDKNALALALLERYVEDEDILFDDIMNRARELDDDPLHAALIGLKLLAEMMADLPNCHPGCMVATVCYQDRIFDEDVRQLNKQAVLDWRRRFGELFNEIAKKYPPHDPNVSMDDLGDMVSTIADGGIIVSKALDDKDVLPRQIMLLRSYIKLLFTPRTR